MIYAYLTRGEAANLRFLSRNMAVVGLHYLVPTVHLDLEEDSFNKLRDIADHPVVSKHVHELIYEVDRLQSLSWEDWSQRISFEEYNASRARGAPEQRFPEEQLHQEWHQFRDACIKQSAICNSRSLSAKLGGALVRFPNLRSVRMSSKSTMTRWLEGFTQRLGASWDQDAVMEEWRRCDGKVGLGSTQSVLRAIGSHNLPITRLCLDSLNWQFLAQHTRDFKFTKKSFCYLRDLSLRFVTHKFGLRVHTSAANAFITKQRGRLLALFSAAPDLQTLRLFFGLYYPRAAIPFGHPCDMFHWKSLEAVELRAFETSENELLDFFSRHADSLRSVTLADIELSHGTWLSTLHRMRQTLQLKHAHAHAKLYNLAENGIDIERYKMDRTVEVWDEEREVFVISPCLGDLVSQYLQEHDKADMTFESYLASLRLEHLGVPLGV